MYPFTVHKARTRREAIEAGRRGGRFIAGGTTLVDLMREEVERPTALVDIAQLPLRGVSSTANGVRIGALATMSEVAAHSRIRADLSMVSEALELSASAQLRNMASIGGNLLQRTRCSYFRDVSAACNKRDPGSGCAALEGYNRSHAILGGSGSCVATHGSDLAVALVALDASVVLEGPTKTRVVRLEDLLLKPGRTPHREHALGDADLITAVDIPRQPEGLRSGYLKVRDRESYEFALTSAAVGLLVDNGVVRAARVAAGGVGTVPWRLRAVEQQLVGRRPSASLWARAAARAAEGAERLEHNGFKVELLTRTVERQLRVIGEAGA